jgi:hypothetical protein
MHIMIRDLLEQKQRILAYEHILVPDIRWDGTRRRSEILDASLEIR